MVISRLPFVAHFLATRNALAYASFNSSVRYLGVSALAFSRNSANCFSSSFGGGVVRVATGTPTSRKNLSFPAGEQMQIMRAGLEDVLWNWCVAFDGTLIVSPALTVDVLPRKVTSISPSSRPNV